MKSFGRLIVLMLMAVVFVTGCGSGGGDTNGDLTVTGTQKDNGNGTSDVSFTVQYTNSQTTDYHGLDVSINTSINGALYESFTDVFSSSGKIIYTYTVNNGSSIRLQAQVGDIVSSASAFSTASTLAVTPAALTIPLNSPVNTTNGAAIITGGAPSYSFVSSTSDIGATIALTASVYTITPRILVQNSTGTAKTATLTIVDSNSHTAALTVTY